MVDTRPQSAIPSVGARIGAVLVIVTAGGLGGLLGYLLIDVQCRGECGAQLGVGVLIGSVLTALGTAVVTILALRAMGDWRATR